MAAFTLDGLDDFMKIIEKVGNLDELAPQMINAATPVVEKELKQNIRDAADRGYATGELESAIHATKAKQNEYGYFAAVGATGVDSKGVRNNEKLAYLEYGVDGRQAPHPVMQKTINDSESECMDIMQAVFNEGIENECK